MGPRKRAKPNPAEGSSSMSLPSVMRIPSKSTTTTSSQVSASATSPPTSGPRTPSQTHQREPSDASVSAQKPPKQAHRTRSWYGSWPRVSKSTPSTQVARETILGGTSKPQSTADLSRFDTKKTTDASTPHDADKSNQQSTPLTNMPEDGEQAPSEQKTHVEAAEPGAPEPKNGEEPSTTPLADKDSAPTTEEVPPKAPTTPSQPSSGWLGWLWSSPAPPPPSDPIQEDQHNSPDKKGTASPELRAKEAAEPDVPMTEPDPETVPDPPAAEEGRPEEQQQPATRESSWFGFWSTPTRSVVTATAADPNPPSSTVESDQQPNQATKGPEDVPMEDAPPAQSSSATAQPRAGSTWAFWSRDTGPSSDKMPAPEPQEGRLAVMGESSETDPRQSTPMEVAGGPPKEPPLKTTNKDDQAKPNAAQAKASPSKKSKRNRPQSMEIDDAPTPSRPSTPKADPGSKGEPPIPSKSAPPKAAPENLLLPSFRSTYRMKDNPSILKQLAQFLLRTQQSPTNHVFLSKEPLKIQKALAIGIHGLFPANYLRPMIGQPTGTSIKFSNHCAEAIRRWADSNGCETCEIEKVALEGEGRIGERVENLWKLLLNWIDQIRNADLIVLACHSQGVPVTLMLLAKLIEFGVVTKARIGVCAMAGVSLGPFPDYRSGMGILMGSAAELWEFSKPESDISKRLEDSVKQVLNHGARITYIASIDDQLVPMESAVYSPVNHPYIYRSVFIDGRIHAPDFISNLIGFALKLRNLGVSDHGLIRELSLPLAGSLYSGEGHSRLYDDERVYDLAVAHALETTDVANPTSYEIHKRESLAQPNPYHLPWVMRGLLEEDFVKTELSAETEELLRQFDDWKPVTKALKDVKYRLEAVRSKL